MKAPSQNTAGNLSEVLLARLSAFISERMGMHFAPNRWRDLQSGLRTAAIEMGFDDTERYAERLLAGVTTQRETEILASHLTIGETYFFREINTFEALEQTILPELIKARRGKEKRLRIWSAGCSSGEEPYSLAILLRKLLPDLADWKLTVLATDINPRSLEKAAAGEFGEWSFRAPSPAIKERYFRRVEERRYEIDAEIKKMVSLQYLNLADDSYPSLTTNTTAMDVILCRNVLIYFEPDKIRKVIRNMRRALLEGGWLIVGASEVSQAVAAEFNTVSFPGITAYQKPGAGESPRPGLTYAEPPPVYKIPAVFEPALVMEVPPLRAAVESPSPPPAVREVTYADVEALYEEGRYGDVVARLQEGGVSGGRESEALALWARASANLGDLSVALTLCERALAADKVNPRLYYLRATIQQEQGALAGAAASLKQSLYLDSDFALAHFALGNLARRQGKQGEAGKHYQNALRALQKCQSADELPESDGLTAGRLAAIISSSIASHE